MFSRDAYSYLAQGALLRDGFDPYAVGPVANPGILLDNVSNVWTTTTAPYGPIFLLLGQAITAITGDNVIAGTMLLRLTMLPGLALMMWAVPHLAPHLGGNRPIALWLAVLNPLVLIHLIGGVHNEMLMVGLMAAGIALVLERHHVAGIGVVAVGVAIKATAGVALPFLVWIWMIHEREARGRGERVRAPRRTRSLVCSPRPPARVSRCSPRCSRSASLIAGVGFGWLDRAVRVRRRSSTGSRCRRSSRTSSPGSPPGSPADQFGDGARGHPDHLRGRVGGDPRVRRGGGSAAPSGRP